MLLCLVYYSLFFLYIIFGLAQVAFICPALACYATILFYIALFYYWFYVVLQINK